MPNKLPAQYHDDLLKPGQAFLDKFHEAHPELKLGFVVKTANLAHLFELITLGNAEQNIALDGNKQYELIPRNAHTAAELFHNPASIGYKIGAVLSQIYPTAVPVTNPAMRTHFTFIKDKGLSFTLQVKRFSVYDIGVDEKGEMVYNQGSNSPLQDWKNYTQYNIISAYNLGQEMYAAFQTPGLNEYLKNIAYVFYSFRAEFARNKNFGMDTATVLDEFLNQKQTVDDKNNIVRLATEIQRKHSDIFDTVGKAREFIDDIARRADNVVKNGDAIAQHEAQQLSDASNLKRQLAEHKTAANSLIEFQHQEIGRLTQLFEQQKQVSNGFISMLPSASLMETLRRDNIEQQQELQELSRRLATLEQEKAALLQQVNESGKMIFLHEQRESAFNGEYKEIQGKHQHEMQQLKHENEALKRTQTEQSVKIKSHEHTIQLLKQNKVKKVSTRQAGTQTQTNTIQQPAATIIHPQETKVASVVQTGPIHNVAIPAPVVYQTFNQMVESGHIDKNSQDIVAHYIIQGVLAEKTNKFNHATVAQITQSITSLSQKRKAALRQSADIFQIEGYKELPIGHAQSLLKMVRPLNRLDYRQIEEDPMGVFMYCMTQFKPEDDKLLMDIVPYEAYKTIKSCIKLLNELLKTEYAMSTFRTKKEFVGLQQIVESLLKSIEKQGTKIIVLLLAVVKYHSFILKHHEIIGDYALFCDENKDNIDLDQFSKQHPEAMQAFKDEYLNIYKKDEEKEEEMAIQIFHSRELMTTEEEIDIYPLKELFMLFTFIKTPSITVDDIPTVPTALPKQTSKTATLKFDYNKVGNAHLAWFLRDLMLYKQFDAKFDVKTKKEISDKLEELTKSFILGEKNLETDNLGIAMQKLSSVRASQVFLHNAKVLAEIIYQDYESSDDKKTERVLAFIADYQYNAFNESGRFDLAELLEELLNFVKTMLSLVESDFYRQPQGKQANEFSSNLKRLTTELNVFFMFLAHSRYKLPIASTLACVHVMIMHKKMFEKYVGLLQKPVQLDELTSSIDFMEFSRMLRQAFMDNQFSKPGNAAHIFSRYTNRNHLLDNIKCLDTVLQKVPQKLNIDAAILANHLKYVLLKNTFDIPFDDARISRLREVVHVKIRMNNLELLGLASQLFVDFHGAVPHMTTEYLINNFYAFAQILDKHSTMDDEKLYTYVLAYMAGIYQYPNSSPYIAIDETVDNILRFMKLFHDFVTSGFLAEGSDVSQKTRAHHATQFIRSVEQKKQEYTEALKELIKSQKNDSTSHEVSPIDQEVDIFKQAIDDKRLPRKAMMTFFFNRHKGDKAMYAEVLNRLVTADVIKKEDELFTFKL